MKHLPEALILIVDAVPGSGYGLVPLAACQFQRVYFSMCVYLSVCLVRLSHPSMQPIHLIIHESPTSLTPRQNLFFLWEWERGEGI